MGVIYTHCCSLHNSLCLVNSGHSLEDEKHLSIITARHLEGCGCRSVTWSITSAGQLHLMVSKMSMLHTPVPVEAGGGLRDCGNLERSPLV